MRTCLFCDSTALTREHIWPDWIVKLLPNEKGFRAGRDAHTYPLGQSVPDSAYQWWKKSSLEQQVRAVCGDCNNGWMSKIEQRTVPILTPLLNGVYPNIILKREQRILAVWACLRAFVFERSLREELSSTSERRAFSFANRESIIAPPETVVWLGAFAAGRTVAVRARFESFINDGRRMRAFTCQIGQVGFQVLHCNGPAAEFAEQAQAITSAHLSRHLFEIWPNRFKRNVGRPVPFGHEDNLLFDRFIPPHFNLPPSGRKKS